MNKRLGLVLGVLLASLMVLTACGGGGSQEPQIVNVTLNDDYQILLDVTEVKPGKVTFKTKNVGAIPHDLTVAGQTLLLQAGEEGELTVDLKAGDHTLICKEPGHEALGMVTTLPVK